MALWVASSGLVLSLGMMTTVFFFLRSELRPWDVHEGILGVLVNTAVLVTVSLLGAAQETAHAEAYVRPGAGEESVVVGPAGAVVDTGQ